MIFRKGHRAKFTVIDNQPVDDPTLSFKALGVLVYLLSKPDHWSANYRHLATVHGEGATAVRSALDELVEHGYVVRQRKHLPDGKFEWEMHVHESPCAGYPRTGYPSVDNARIVNTEVVKTEEKTALVVSDFDEWYAAYPLHKARPKAEAAYKKAREKADASVLLAAAQAFAKLEAHKGTEKQFIKHPATWLNQECWTDEIEDPDDQTGYYAGPQMRFG